MSFLDQIIARLQASSDQTLLTELRESGPIPVTGKDLFAKISQARAFIAARGLNKGDRVALLAPNGVNWIVMDLAIIAEGLVVVPLYSRQAPAELVTMMKDCSPALICCGDATLRDSILQVWSQAPAQALFDEIFAENRRAGEAPAPQAR
jgi:long-chain acyl-CoA synthetase